MSRRRKESKSPRQVLIEINDLLLQLPIDRERELKQVDHVPRSEPLPTGRAHTVLTNCADDCPGCAIDRKYILLGQRLGRIQRQAERANASSSLASADGLSRGRAKAAQRQRKPAITPRKYALALSRAKHHPPSQKEIASLLNVSQPTLRAFLKQHPTLRVKLTKCDQ